MTIGPRDPAAAAIRDIGKALDQLSNQIIGLAAYIAHAMPPLSDSDAKAAKNTARQSVGPRLGAGAHASQIIDRIQSLSRNLQAVKSSNISNK